ncbi:chloride channel, putative [Perkinsus marinus ATCC 50983]|uniref:Chloride channel, putative n=1 Tax=Perkinsus marinus (strain ATCC 50983 / TXsc) TaxID=423536 RepID=C5LKV5_PERM5|nr:chloride channel, putative [Perkinsus marinus ATCC 50983]EER02638.1 chloride channel, putative [Perkinsus marinus ATCC 50983]|eukprot:XP_002769920.1 chloride channel, putative [Perkinsus marinus ATCC 50983]
MGDSEYTPGVLILAAVVIFVLTSLTYGLAIPMGLFIPNIMMGACVGRLIGIWMHPLGGSVGSYAVIGAAGMLAGFSRMTISLTAIVVEITGDLQQLPYIMITVIVAKQVADLFLKGAYDLVLEVRQVPYLEELDSYHEYAMRAQ